MRILLPVIGLALVVVCRLATGGEGGAVLTASDPLTALWRTLLDYGALGAFVLYLIVQKKKDGERRDKVDERWHALDNQLVDLVREYSRVTTEVVATLGEIRTNMHEINAEMRRINSMLSTGGAAAKK